ncbi:hypothetical protein ABZ942_27860 [Nocardia sp. NPDC046473]|uniref:hypothetical protein n=1 Tax=Nocardia sp. NPDC046473 TaxID=3155733 RepID=UPI0033F313D0
MSDGYDRDRDGFDSNQRGRIFENGSYEYFRDRKYGYVQQSEKFRAAGVKIRFDKLSKDSGRVRSIEEKSGQMKGPKDEKQLEVVYELIRTGKIDHHTLRTVERELISDRCLELIDKIRRDFPDKFTHLEISRTEAREIWAKGLAIERGLGQQLELDQVREKARDGKVKALENRREKIALLAKARAAAERLRKMQLFRQGAARGRAEAPARLRYERAQAAELAKAREQEAREKPARELADKKAALAKALENQARRINKAWEKGQAVDLAQVREAHTDLSKGLKEIREAERAQALQMLTATGYTKQQAQTMQAMLEQERERQRRDVVLGINTLGVIVERADKAAPAKETGREPTDAERQQAEREKAQRERTEELQRLYREGQARPPQAAVREPPEHAPPVQGRGRDGQGITRGPERTR